jgi:excisionase family DNA binding protein
VKPKSGRRVSNSATSLERDAEALQRALESDGDEVSVSLSRETVELMVRFTQAEANGQQVIVTRGLREVSPSEAAMMLGMSRPQVRKLLDEGVLSFRLVGTHHRIPAAEVQAFLRAERERRRSAMADLVALQNELGLTE